MMKAMMKVLRRIDKMTGEEAKKVGAFTDWANVNGINMEDEDDWKPWWLCWLAGYEEGYGDAVET